MTYRKDKTDELLSFRAEKIDLVLDIPVEEVQNVLGTLPEAQSGENVKHKVDSKASLSNTYYGFTHDSEIFKDKRVRKAFNLAIDRKVMIENWLEGEGWPIDYGFVPKMKGYPYENIKGFVFNPEEAQIGRASCRERVKSTMDEGARKQKRRNGRQGDIHDR